jgi:hypothetical protein
MATPQSGLPGHPKPDRPKPARLRPARPRVVVRVSIAFGGVGGIAGMIYWVLARHAPFSTQAGVFENLLAVIMLTALAMLAFTVTLEYVARARLRYLAGRKALETVQSHDQALRTLRALNSSVSGRLTRWWLELPVVPDEDDEDGGNGVD